MSDTAFPLGVYAGNPNGNSPSGEQSFETAFNSFVADMGATPQYMDGYVDLSIDPSQWGSNASYTAWSWATSPVVGTSITPVIGVPMATNADWNNQDAFFQAIANGQYDSDYRAIVDSWAEQGFHTMDLRVGYEMNGSFMPWYMGDDPQTQSDWVSAFRHIATIEHDEGAKDGATVNIVWNPDQATWTSTDVANLYPGDQYVDIIATDSYSPTYANDTTDWATGGTSFDSSSTDWASNPWNRAHYWTYPSANFWQPQGQAGVGWSVEDTIQLAEQHGKPIGIGETGAGGDGGSLGPVDDSAFPAWLYSELTQEGAPQVAFVNIWDTEMSDGNWQFTGPGADKPGEAWAWAQYFGAGSASASLPYAPASFLPTLGPLADDYPGGAAMNATAQITQSTLGGSDNSSGAPMFIAAAPATPAVLQPGSDGNPLDYSYNAGDGAMMITDFNVGAGDQLVLDSSLQPMAQGTTTSGGLSLSFGHGDSLLLENVSALPQSAIVWS